MPVNKIKGLQGLKGLNSLGDEYRRTFMESNADKLNVYRNPRQRRKAAEILFMNQQFKNLLDSDKGFKNYLGVDSFDQINDGTENSFNLRNQLLKEYSVSKALKDTFGRDDDYQSLVAGLDADGMYELLNNEEYLGTTARKQKLADNIKEANKVKKDYDSSINNPYTDALGAGYMQVGKTASALEPYQQDAKYAEKDKEILDKLFSDTQKRREDAVEGITNSIYDSIITADSNGTKSIAKSYAEFDKLATKNSPHYATFKNSKWLKNYSNEDKLKDYAKYQAIEKQYGQGTAMQYLDRSIQNRVAEAQDGSWTGNTLKGVLTTAWSDLGSNIALFANIGKSPEEIAIINQGKDINKPIYDKSGQIVDYEKREDWLTNPAYWNNVYKYNTFSPTEIKAIEERGGVSEDVNVRQYGDTPDFLSWDTVEEGFKQGGHILAGVVETGLTGAFGKAAGAAMKGVMKGVGLSAKTMQTASKVGTITNDLFVTATTGLEGSQLEAMGTFDEQMQTSREKIQNQINKELYEYSRDIDYTSKEATSAIDAYYKALKAEDKKRVLAGNREGVSTFPLSDEVLKQQAKQHYTNQLLESKQKELQELHRKDELEAAKAATSAYGTNFIMDYVKNIPLTVGIQKFKIAKGAMRGAFDNIVDKNIIADAATGGVKRAVDKAGNAIRYSSAKGLSKEVVKQLGGGFADEYFDGVNASFASGVGSNEFDNYIKKNYDPQAYNSTVDGMLGNILAGFTEGISGLTDRQNLYEGFIGMVAPGATVMVNPNIVFSPKDTWKAVVGGVDSNGRQISVAERMSNVITNPILNSIADAKEKDRQLDSVVESVNNIVANNKEKIEDASKIISVLGNYDSPLTLSAVNSTDSEGEDNSISFIDSKDNKLYNCFTLINVLNGLGSVAGGSKSKLYQDTMETIQGLAEGKLSEEAMNSEIDRFLADEDNKSILDDKNGREIAAERLQKNAQYFMDMKDKMAEIDGLFAKSPTLKNVDPRVQGILKYNLVATDDYEKRLKSLEEELSLNTTDTKTASTPDFNVRYGTKGAKETAVAAKEREISKVEKQQAKLADKKEGITKKIESLKNDVKFTSDGEKIKNINSQLKKQQELLQTIKFEEASLNEKKQLLAKDRDAIKGLIKEGDTEEGVFDENEILSLSAEDRAAVLNPKNRQNYSKEQLAVIDNVINNLLQKDPEALMKIEDAGMLASRINDLKTVYSKILNNDKLATTYLNSAEYVRNNAAMSESIQRGIEEHYSKIEDAYNNISENPNSLKEAIFATNSQVVGAYMEDHPKQVAAIQPYYDILKLDEDVAAVINNSDSSTESKIQQLINFSNIQGQSNSAEEIKQRIEEAIDSPDVSEEDKANFDYLLSSLETMGYQRDATVVESREQRKKREEEIRKKAEEEKAKKEAEAKAAAERAAKEIAKKSQKSNAESSDKKNVSNDNINPNGVGIEITEDTPVIDLENSEVASDNAPNVETDNAEIDKKSQKSEEKKVGTIAKPKGWDAYESYITPEATTEQKATTIWNLGDNISPTEAYQYLNSLGTSEDKAIADKLAEIAKSKGVDITKNSSEKNVADSEKSSTFADAKAETNGNEEMKDTESTAETINEDGYVVTDNGETKCKTLSIEEMAADAAKEGINVEVSGVTEDSSVVNALGEQKIKSDQTTLSGNAMGEYNMDNLIIEGSLVHKRGGSPTDNMNKYFTWMEAAGIKLQNIIDQELGEIIKRNPHAKVKFMRVKPESNATHDDYMQTHLMLVLDYDNAINKGIKNIHLDANGGVIKSNGKEYLVVGVVGYGIPKNNPGKLALYDTIFSEYEKTRALNLKKSAWNFFKANKAERFYVEEGYSTEIVPKSIIPGYIVKQGYEDESNKKDIPLSELLDPKNGRNPYGFTWDTIPFGIQGMDKFLTIRASKDDVMVPRKPNDNLGNGFVLVPAGNAKFVPVHFNVRKYNEMNEGALKAIIDKLLNDVVNATYATRFKAREELKKLFYFSNGGTNIILHPTKPEVTLVTDGGDRLPTFNLADEDFTVTAFMEAFKEVNPRINITPSVLDSPTQLQMYDEAGALMLDVAMLATAGSSYSIYGVDKEGNMIIPNNPVNSKATTSNKESNYVVNKHRVPFRGQLYHEENGTYYLNTIPVTDANVIKQLDYNRMIEDKKLSPVKSDTNNFYYVLSNGEHPEAVKVNKNSKEVEVLSEEASKELTKNIDDKKSMKERDLAATAALENASDVIDLGPEAEYEMPLEVDAETGETIYKTDEQQIEKVEESTEKTQEATIINKEESTQKSVENLESSEHKANTQTFVEMFNSSDFATMIKIMNIIKGKWKNAPTDNMDDLSKFLKGVNMDVESIGTSKEDINTWIETLENCR